MILKLPEGAPRGYVRKVADRCGRLNELWPIFNRKLRDPEDLSNAVWVEADDYVPERHVYHYSLPQIGRMQDLVRLATRAHERPMDRSRPLWEVHVIEGLPGDRFALYCKVHHALVDGVGAMKMLQGLFSTDPRARLDFSVRDEPLREHHHHGLFDQVLSVSRGLLRQYRAIPELSGLLAHMGADALRGKADAMRLPFTAPRTLFNTELNSHRSMVLCDLPFGVVKSMARQAGGSVNDVLLAICGGALRRYLLAHDGLPRASLVAGMPVSLKSGDADTGNKLSYIMAPFFTNEADDRKRLRRVIKVTSAAKQELTSVSTTAAEDYYALIMAPTILLTVTGNAMRVRPAINAIFSNVPGSRERLYLEGAELEALYPLSIVTDAMGLNITVVSHVNKLCIAIASCPTDQPDIDGLDKLIRESYRSLRDALRAER
jgi:WS/DGAT/MGAT family acyltransferase